MAYITASDVTFFQFPKSLAVRRCLVHLAQRDIHKCITVNQVSVERLSVFQFDHLPKCVTRMLDHVCSAASSLTMGLPCAAFNSANGSYASLISKTRPNAHRCPTTHHGG